MFSGTLHSKTQMENTYGTHLVMVLCFLGMLLIMPSSCQDDLDDGTNAVYIVTLRQVPTSHYQDELSRVYNHFRQSASGRTRSHKPRYITPFTIFVFKVWKMFRLYIYDD
jgi:hypothetical protein